MRTENSEGCGRRAAPHPSEYVEVPSDAAEYSAEAHPGKEKSAQADSGRGDLDAARRNRAPGGQNRLSSLTDVPAVRDYFNRIGAEARSLKTAVVKEREGKY